MKTICLINVFFGKFPWYFNFFLKSCESNLTVNFLIFTDQPKPVHSPSNVFFIFFSLEKFNHLASQKLKISINIKYPYKLCDFKPAYGIIFFDYIKDYDFWGITDIDIIFGRIREFIDDKMVDYYEVISVRNDYPTGSFMLFKNDEKINGLFKKSKDYELVFTSDKHFCFDECNFYHQYLQDGGNIFNIKTEIESMHHVLQKEMEVGNIKVHFDFLIIEGLPGNLYWDNGILSFKKKFEVLLYHMILYKQNIYSKKVNFDIIPTQFYIQKYNIRKVGLIQKINYFLEKILIFVKKTLLAIDSIISRKIINNKATQLLEGNFKNGSENRILFKGSDNFFSLSFGTIASFIVYKSVFRNNIFYVGGDALIYYKFDVNNDLIETFIDGSTMKLKRD